MAEEVVNIVIEAAGGALALAKTLKITHQAVYRWKRRNRIPLMKVLEIERIFGISRHRMRPDVYPEDYPPVKKRNTQGRG